MMLGVGPRLLPLPGRWRRLTWHAGGIALLTGACAGASAPPTRAEPSLLDLVKAATGSETAAARWIYHPKGAAALLSEAPIAAGATIMVGVGGERWLVRRSDGTAKVSPWLAPEPLVAVQRSRDGWSFVGAQGTIYAASEPLGPLISADGPPEVLRVVDSRADSIAGITARGRLVASSAPPRSWVAVGPALERFADVAIDASGRGLALAVPESLWAAEAVTGEWRKLNETPFGAQSVEYAEGSGIVVEGVLGRFGYSPTDGRLSPRVRGADAATLKLGVAVPVGPSATAIRHGLAVLDGSDYVELRHTDEDWRLLHGSISGPLEARTAKALKGCGLLRLAGRGSMLMVICGAEASLTALQPLAFFSSADHGAHWARLSETIRGTMGDARLAIARSGDALLTGICPPQESSARCAPQGVYWYRRARSNDPAPPARAPRGEHGKTSPARPRRGASTRLGALALPDLDGVADEIVIPRDGTSIYVIGRRLKTGRYAVYVSDESGRSFAVRDLGPLPEPFGHSDDDSDGQFARRGSLVQRASVGQDGSLAIELAAGRDRVLVVTDPKGELRTIARPPRLDTLLAGSGARVLALEAGTGEAWESLDGGASWDAVEGLPRAICPGDPDCSLPVVCAVGGCLVADEWTRAGWGGAPSPERLTPPLRPASPPAIQLGPPWACQLDDGMPWRAIDGAKRPPRADDAAIGGASWFVTASEPGSASANVTVLRRGRAAPDIEVLLAPLAQPERYALSVSPQIEGAAALRYRVPAKGEAKTGLRGVEVAWLNLFTGRKLASRIADAGPYRPGDTSRPAENVEIANPNLLSIAGDGIFVRVHAVSAGSQTTYFLNGRTVVSLPPVTSSVLVSGAHHEMARVDGESVALVTTNNGAIMRGDRDGASWRWSAFSLMMPDAGRFQVAQSMEITYVASRAAFHVVSSWPDATLAAVYPFERDGAVVGRGLAAPTLADVKDANLPCADAQRGATPRLVTPADPRFRFPIVLRDALEPERVLVSGRVVLHGTVDSPCVAALEGGEVTEPLDGRAISALIYPGDPSHAWAFRVSTQGDEKKLEYRRMECRPEPDLRLPDETLKEFQGRLGTIVSASSVVKGAPLR